MATVSSDKMTQLSCRSDIARSAVSRSNAAPSFANHMEADGTLLFNRDLTLNGNPRNVTESWTTTRE